MLIFTNKIVEVDYNEELKLITYKEHGIAKNNLILEQLQAVLDFSKTHAVVAIIADFRKLQGSFKGVFDFLNTEYYPVLKSRGLKCKAFVLNEDIINNHLATSLIESLQQHKIEASLFSDTEQAINWVNKMTE